MFRFAGLASAFFILLAATLPHVDTQPSSQPATSASSQPAVDKNMVLARTNKGDFTVGDLEDVVKATFPQQTPSEKIHQILIQPKSVLQVLAKDTLAQREIVKQYNTTSPTLKNRWIDDIILSEGKEVQEKLRHQIEEKTKNISEEQARKYYEQNKVKYHTPLEFHMRHLSLTTMVEYTVKPGDTLESIAKAISGSEENVSKILTNTTGKLKRWVPENERHRRPFIPLSPGESLLVPMNPQDRQTVRKLMEETILPQIQQGVPLEELAKKYSEAPDKGMEIGPLPFGTTPFLPELLNVARTIPIGQPSGIIDTLHGFEIIQITKRTDEKQKTFEEVKEEIEKELAQEQLKIQAAQLTMSLWGNLKINNEVIQKKEGPADEVAVTTKGGFKWTRKDMERLIGESIGNQRTPDNILSAIQGNHVIVAQLYIEHAREIGIYETDREFARRIELRRENLLSQRFVEFAVDSRKKNIKEEDVRAWYQEHIKEFTPPTTYDVRQIVIRLNPDADLSDPAQRAKAEAEALDKLRSGTRRVETKQDFIAAVRKLSEDTASKERQGSVGQIIEGYRAGKFAEVLSKLQPQTVSEPFIHNDMAYVIWIDDRQEKSAPKFEDQKDNIRAHMLARIGRETEDQVIQEALERIGFQLV